MKTARLLAAALLLTGCSEPDAGEAAAGVARSEVDSARPSASLARYEACLDKADAPEIRARCAETAVASATGAAPAFADFLRDLGDAALAGDDNASHRLVVANAAARLAIGRSELLAEQKVRAPSEPVSSPAHIAQSLLARWQAIRDADCRSAVAVDRCAQVADRLFQSYIAVAMPAVQENTTMSTRAVPDCATLLTTTADPQSLLDEFEQSYPAAYADPALVDDAVPADAVPQLARSLACLAGVTAFEGYLADQASALFASSRHGPAAFAALAAAAKTTGREADYARSFADQMRAVIRPPSG